MNMKIKKPDIPESIQLTLMGYTLTRFVWHYLHNTDEGMRYSYALTDKAGKILETFGPYDQDSVLPQRLQALLKDTKRQNEVIEYEDPA